MDNRADAVDRLLFMVGVGRGTDWNTVFDILREENIILQSRSVNKAANSSLHICLISTHLQCWSKVSHILGYNFSVTPVREGG